MLITELNELRRELKVLKLNTQRGPHLRSDASVNKDVESSNTRINELQLELDRKNEELKEFKRLMDRSAERAKEGQKLGPGDYVGEKLKATSSEPIDISKSVSFMAQESQENAAECSALETAHGESPHHHLKAEVAGVDSPSEHDQGNVQVEASNGSATEQEEHLLTENDTEERVDSASESDQDIVPAS
jgi:hypothetical protein